MNITCNEHVVWRCEWLSTRVLIGYWPSICCLTSLNWFSTAVFSSAKQKKAFNNNDSRASLHSTIWVVGLSFALYNSTSNYVNQTQHILAKKWSNSKFAHVLSIVWLFQNCTCQIPISYHIGVWARPPPNNKKIKLSWLKWKERSILFRFTLFKGSFSYPLFSMGFIAISWSWLLFVHIPWNFDYCFIRGGWSTEVLQNIIGI